MNKLDRTAIENKILQHIEVAEDLGQELNLKFQHRTALVLKDRYGMKYKTALWRVMDVLCDDYGLDKREKLQLKQLIKDMGYPMLLDRMNAQDDNIDPTNREHSEFSKQYYS